MHSPKKISKAIIALAINGAKKKLEIPKSTKMISNGSIGNNFDNPETIKTTPTITLRICEKYFI